MKGLVFYPKSHRYKLDGKWVPGVTTILGVLDKPGLKKWAAQTVAEYVADNREAVGHLYSAGRGPMVAALKEIPWQKRDDAADRGTQLHDFADHLLRGDEIDVPHDLAPVMDNAIRFLKDWQIEPLLIEECVASRAHSWAGKFDLVGRYVNPRQPLDAGVGIFDWKSGKRIYESAAFQLNAYGHAEFHGENGDESPMLDLDIRAAFGVHIHAYDYAVHPLPYGPKIYQEFLNIRETFEINKRAKGDWKTPGSGYVGLPVAVSPFDDSPEWTI